MNEQYSVIAKFYELLNSDVDYKGYADFCRRIIEKYGEIETVLGLDLACGTGKLTRELADLGYDMTGVDLSFDMLSIAMEKEREEKKNILYLNQDMREFELYGTVDFCVCSLDGINYLLNADDVDKCFSLVHNYLAPNGLFIFDINTKARFDKFKENDFVMEEDGVLLAWQNYYDEDTDNCDFLLSFFEEQSDGCYKRYDEEQTEHFYSNEELEILLKKNNLELLGIYGDFDMKTFSENDEKIFIVAKCKKSIINPLVYHSF